MHPTEPSFISLHTYSLANTELNRKFKSKLAWFNLVLLVGKEEWSLGKREIYRRKRRKTCVCWSKTAIVYLQLGWLQQERERQPEKIAEISEKAEISAMQSHMWFWVDFLCSFGLLFASSLQLFHMLCYPHNLCCCCVTPTWTQLPCDSAAPSTPENKSYTYLAYLDWKCLGYTACYFMNCSTQHSIILTSP